MVNIKEIKSLRGGGLQVAAQANVQIDAEIGQKDHFPMETLLKMGGIIGQKGIGRQGAKGWPERAAFVWPGSKREHPGRFFRRKSPCLPSRRFLY
ncbi:hypothetical protein [Desulfatiglans anilini]|uniref:hypothetical protein n=1 Tax=Desulfatiglans anilini TaxID=90728 RepID=UPI0004825BDC|nr:hypothetical protein [Desulfatiglans anilini]